MRMIAAVSSSNRWCMVCLKEPYRFCRLRFHLYGAVMFAATDFVVAFLVEEKIL